MNNEKFPVDLTNTICYNITINQNRQEIEIMNTIGIIGAMPSELADIRTMLDKAEIKRISGFDFYINEYKGKKVMRYTYKVTNYEGYGDTVFANLLVHKNKIIGGDICSADPNGFAHGLKK